MQTLLKTKRELKLSISFIFIFSKEIDEFRNNNFIPCTYSYLIRFDN